MRPLSLVAFTLGIWTMPGTASGAIAVSQTVDRTEMAFEDTATFEVVVTWEGPAHAYRFDKAFRLLTDRLKVARFSSSVSSTGSGPNERTTKTFKYKLAPILSGNASIEPLVVEYISWPDSLTGQLVTDPITIIIAEPRPAGVTEDGSLSGGWLAVIIVAILGVGVGVFSLFRPKAPQEKMRTPAEIFLDDLEAVKNDSSADLKEFQTGLYKSLAAYVKATYQIEVEGLSADAIVAGLARVETESAVCMALGGWLVRAEKEKYTPLAAAPGEVTRLESEVRQFFQNMK